MRIRDDVVFGVCMIVRDGDTKALVVVEYLKLDEIGDTVLLR